jgi:hypothetical protein
MMTYYALLLPQATLLLGILATLIGETFFPTEDKQGQWRIHLAVLILATFQQLLIYRVGSTIYLRGGMVLDGISQLLSLAILSLALLAHFNRRRERRVLTSQSHLLSLGVTLFALCTVQANRFLFGVFAIVAMILVCQGALASESKRFQQIVIIQSSVLRGVVYLLGGVLLCVFCLATFGETQIDEIQRMIVRPHINESMIHFIEIMILFMAAVVMGIPPFQGFWGRSRQSASWSLVIATTGTFAVVGLGLFLRWAVMLFSRAAVGQHELEPLSQTDVFLYIRVISVVGLILVPAMALMSRKLRPGILIFTLNPFVQILYSISFGQREVLGFAAGHILLSVFNLGLLIYAIRTLNISEDFSLTRWAGIGHRALIPTLVFILSLTSLAGLAPFFGSMLLQKTLCIKTMTGFALLLNVALSGYYVVYLAELAFQGGRGQELATFPLSRMQKFWFIGQFVVLIFVGIFWQPLYKYGAYSIRGLFGDI